MSVVGYRPTPVFPLKQLRPSIVMMEQKHLIAVASDLAIFSVATVTGVAARGQKSDP